MAERKSLIIENANIIFGNFSGEANNYNHAGDRNFCLIIDDPRVAEQLKEDGWTIKTTKPRDEGDAPRYYTKVRINYRHNPRFPDPEIHRIVGNESVLLAEEELGILDRDRILSADVKVDPVAWNVNGKSGIAGYLQVMYVRVEALDPFASKYTAAMSEDDEYGI